MNEVKKILVPVDFSDNSKKILQSAIYFAERCQAAIRVVFVVQNFDDYSGFFVPHMPVVKLAEEMVEGAQKKMAEFLQETLDGKIPYQSKVLSGDVAEEIILYAESEAIDMIIMGTHGYRGIEKILFGSVAEKVVKTAPCPVLVINPYK